MELIKYLGKCVYLYCTDGTSYHGYVFDLLDAEDSGIGEECLDIAPLDRDYLIAIPIREIEIITVDDRYIDFDFFAGSHDE